MSIADTLSCIDVCDATGVIIAQNGVAPFSYLWGNGQINDTALNLCYGINNVIITDANGCLDTNQVFIENPDTLQLSNITIDSACYQTCDGLISVTITGGASPYSTSWNYLGVEFNNTDTITNNDLCAGNYQLIFSDANNCINSSEFLLIERDSFQLQDWIINDSCFNSCTGQITVQLLNQDNPPFIYDWDNGQSDTVISNLCSDTINLTVIDSRLCREDYNFLVLEGDSMFIDSVAVTNNICFGDSNGVITLINFTGGVSPLTYNWSNGETTTAPGINSILSGVYSVNITDAFGCSLDSANILIDHPDSLFITPSFLTNTSCFGSSDGIIDVDIFGGITPYFISWNNIIPDSSLIDTVPAGVYIYTIVDSNLCTLSDTIIIEEPEALSLTDSLINILCKSENTGEIHLTVFGGTFPYSFSIDNGVTFQSQSYFNNLEAGSYSVIVKDNNECLLYSPLYNLTEPLTTLSISLLGPDLSCFSDTGTIFSIVNGGTPNYSFLWSNGAITQNIYGVEDGIYTLSAFDNNNCEIIETINVEQPDEIEILSTTTDLLCFESNLGSINLLISGGVSPYDYNWSNGNSTSNINNLAAGTYNFIITDINNCIKTESFIINEPPLLQVFSQHINVDCFGNNSGEIDVSVNGGTPQYSFNWSGFGNNEDLLNVPADNYNLTVTDANFCSTSISVFISEPNEIVYNVQLVDLLCNNIPQGEIIINASGGTPGYFYSTDGGGSYQSNNIFTSLQAGNYSVWIKDANSCSKHQSFSIYEPNSYSNLGTSQLDIDKCFGDATGSISLIISGQTSPYAYNWSNGETSTSINNLNAGTYNVIVSDVNNCEITYSYLILEPEILELEYDVSLASCEVRNDGFITTFVKGGTPPISYQWSNGENSSDIFNLSKGSYSLYIIDDQDCSIPIQYFDVGFNSLNTCIEIPSGFTPNNDNIHDEWIIYGLNDFDDVVVNVFNRWGQLVFTSNEVGNNWNGKYNGEDLPTAAYYYVIELKELDKIFNGTVTIKR